MMRTNRKQNRKEVVHKKSYIVRRERVSSLVRGHTIFPAAVEIATGSGTDSRAPATSLGEWNGKVNLKMQPWLGLDSTQILPPLRAMIFVQMAKPIPLPGYSVRVCNL